jgi:hypothetical protein
MTVNHEFPWFEPFNASTHDKAAATKFLQKIDTRVNSLERRISSGEIPHETLSALADLINQARTLIRHGSNDRALDCLESAEDLLAA